ncbi:MAG: hypothetical protein Q9168_001360 [Polycauliona sp. 1 TL-2023]
MITIPVALTLLITTATCSPLQHPHSLPLEKRDDLLTTINGWRYALGAQPLSWSQDMANAAASTGQQNQGGAAGQTHHPARNAAEVIAPGSDNSMGKDLKGRSPFEISFIAWICERPSSQMGDACELVNPDTNDWNAVMHM